MVERIASAEVALSFLGYLVLGKKRLKLHTSTNKNRKNGWGKT
jgi:hypothetical protein